MTRAPLRQPRGSAQPRFTTIPLPARSPDAATYPPSGSEAVVGSFTTICSGLASGPRPSLRSTGQPSVLAFSERDAPGRRFRFVTRRTTTTAAAVTTAHVAIPETRHARGGGSCVISASGPSDCPPEHPFIPSLDRADGGGGASGYPCRHQSGWGKESADGQRQEPSPVYWWNNKSTSGSTVSLKFDISPWFTADRDYCNHSPSSSCGTREAWSYTPLAYPHPLQTGTPAVPRLSPPSSLRIE